MSKCARGLTSPMMTFEVSTLPRVHPAFVRFVVMVLTQHVQHSVHQQECQFVVERARMPRSLIEGHGGTDHDVSQQQRQVAEVRRRLVRTLALRPRTRCAHGLDHVEGKCQHIRRTRLAHVLRVQVRHGLAIHVDHRHLGRSRHPLVAQHTERKLLPTRQINRVIRLFICAENLRLTVATGTTRSEATNPWVDHA